MRYNKLKNIGAIEVEPLQYSHSTPKASGYMYVGQARLSYRTMLFDFFLWHHAGDEVTQEEVEREISLKRIFFEGRWYDVHWHTIMSEDEIYLHREGWFGNNILHEKLRPIQVNYNIDRTPQQKINPIELLSMGFIRII